MSRFVGRRRPELVVRVPLEGRIRVELRAETYADERRLRAWLRRQPQVIQSCGSHISDALDQLDEADVRGEAA